MNNSEDCVDDLDMLVNLLDDERPNEDQSISMSKVSMASGTTSSHSSENKIITPKQTLEIPNCTIDPLELELRQMEEKMNKIKEELYKKKNFTSKSTKPNFTKYASVVHKSTETSRTLNETEKNNLIANLKKSKSNIHDGETDSEDEEDNRNPMETHFTNSGHDIRKRLAHAEDSEILSKRTDINPFNNKNGWKEAKGGSLLPMGKASNTMVEEKTQGIADPFSGIKLVNPIVSASAMNELMSGRRMIQISSIKLQLIGGDIEGDWVTIAVLAGKSDPKTSQKGSQYSIWTLTDLKDCTVVISLFLFADAYKKLWKTTVGSVIGILNPQIMKEREDEKRNALTISVNMHQKILMMGTSKDLGWCKGRTLANGQCKNFVNKSICEFCIYHIQREYKKSCSKRSEIQSSFTRVDPRKALQNKVLGKNQVFYGGQLYGSSPLSTKEGPVVRSRTVPANLKKDLATLSSLNVKNRAKAIQEEESKPLSVTSNLSDNVVSTIKEVTKENESLGVRLLAPTPGARNLLMHKIKEPLEKSTKSTEEQSARELLDATKKEMRLKMKNGHVSKLHNSPLSRVPQLGRGLSPNKGVEFDLSPTNSKMSMAKLRAASIVKSKGGLESVNKNVTRNKNKASTSEFQMNVKKRLHEEGDEEEDNSPKAKLARTEDAILNKNKSMLGSIDLNSDKFKAMLDAKSKHTNLIQVAEDEEMEKYYNNLEQKEMIENKMTSTMEVPTVAVICLKCKYKASSAAEHCRKEQHPLKCIKAVRRFFECRNCKRRTTSLSKLPSQNCSSCSQSSWKRVGMGKERVGPKLDTEVLSLRGDELGHYSGTSNKVYLHI